ncbi:L-fucono-1,5-lactonase-like [Styela clava]
MEDANEPINVIDTHFHVWELEKWKYNFPTPSMKEIYRNFYVSDYEEDLKKTPIKHGIYVQVENNVQETRWIIEKFREKDSVIGIVGYAHINNPDLLDKELAEFTKDRKFVGVRNIIPDEVEGYLGQERTSEGMKVIKKYDLVYDLLIKEENFQDALSLVRKNPATKFNINHLAKPNAKTGASKAWYEGMSALAEHNNVHCKLSGMVTEGDLQNWKPEDFKNHVQHVMDKFGADRVMFGSDWPVCKMANADLDTVYNLLDQLLSDFTEQKKKIFRTNAIELYNLKL